MIKDIIFNPTVIQSHFSSTGYQGYSNNPVNISNVRWHDSNGLEYYRYDQNQWFQVPSKSITIDLQPDIREIIEWARKKMQQESKLEELLKQHPDLRDIHNKYQVMLSLCS